MRYSVLLPLLLAACGTFGFGEKSEKSEKSETTSTTTNTYSYCNVPQRLMILRTSSEYCRILGGYRVDDSKADELESYYQDLTSN